MSNVNVNTDIEVDFELTESEKDNLVRSYKILRNLSKDLWENDVDETEEFMRVCDAKDYLEEFLRRDLGIEVK